MKISSECLSDFTTLRPVTICWVIQWADKGLDKGLDPLHHLIIFLDERQKHVDFFVQRIRKGLICHIISLEKFLYATFVTFHQEKKPTQSKCNAVNDFQRDSPGAQKILYKKNDIFHVLHHLCVLIFPILCLRLQVEMIIASVFEQSKLLTVYGFDF